MSRTAEHDDRTPLRGPVFLVLLGLSLVVGLLEIAVPVLVVLGLLRLLGFV